MDVTLITTALSEVSRAILVILSVDVPLFEIFTVILAAPPFGIHVALGYTAEEWTKILYSPPAKATLNEKRTTNNIAGFKILLICILSTSI
jgi:hypothetical protein